VTGEPARLSGSYFPSYFGEDKGKESDAMLDLEDGIGSLKIVDCTNRLHPFIQPLFSVRREGATQAVN
jgi:hypothetical protein